MQQAQDLDHIIAAHEGFLDTIISRCLLDADSRVSPGDCWEAGAVRVFSSWAPVPRDILEIAQSPR